MPAPAVDNHMVTLPTTDPQCCAPDATPFADASGGKRVMGFVVFGAAKSGSTWMQRLLSVHPRLHCAESRAFGEYFDPNNPTAIHLTIESFVRNLSRYYHPPAGSDCDFYDRMLFSIVDAIGRTTLEQSGKSVYGEKITPYWGTGLAVIERLASYSSDLRFVHLLRDPRDVVVSGFVHQANIRIASGHSESDRYRACLDAQRVDDQILESSLSLWIDSNRAGFEGGNRFERSLMLRYEDLVASPREQIEELLRFLGVEHDPATVRHCVDGASFEALSGGRARGEEDRASFFRKGVAGDWVNWLSDAQVQLILDQAGDLIERAGYPIGARA